MAGRLLAALGSALLLGGCGSGPEPGAPPVAPATPGVPRPSGDPTGPAKVACPPDGALIREIVVSAALGLRGMSLELVNCGSAPYRLKGFPAPRLRDADGQPMAVRIVPGATGIASGFDAPPRPLVLAPGDRAQAALLWRNTVTDATVPAANGRYLEVAPGAGPAGPAGRAGRADRPRHHRPARRQRLAAGRATDPHGPGGRDAVRGPGGRDPGAGQPTMR